MATTKVMAVGDSNTLGALALVPRTDGWPGYRGPLATLLAGGRYLVDWVGPYTDPAGGSLHHYGTGGFTCNQVSADFPGWASYYQPRIVLLMVGTADMFAERDTPPDSPGNASNRLAHLLEVIYATDPSIVTIVSEILPIDGSQNQAAFDAAPYVAAYNAAIPDLVAARVAAGQDVRWQPFGATVPANDGLHFTTAGYATLAGRWYASLGGILVPRPQAPVWHQAWGGGAGNPPTFSWDRLEGPVTGYALYSIGPNDPYAYELVASWTDDQIPAGAVATVTAPGQLAVGGHFAWLIAWNQTGWGVWSDVLYYQV